MSQITDAYDLLLKQYQIGVAILKAKFRPFEGNRKRDQEYKRRKRVLGAAVDEQLEELNRRFRPPEMTGFDPYPDESE